MKNKVKESWAVAMLFAAIIIVLAGFFASEYLVIVIMTLAIVALVNGIGLKLVQRAQKRKEEKSRLRDEENQRKYLEGLKEVVLEMALGDFVKAAAENVSANKFPGGEEADGVSLIRIKQFGDSIIAYMKDDRSSLALAVGGRGHYVLQFGVRVKEGQIEIEVLTGSYTIPSNYFNYDERHAAVITGLRHIRFFRLFP